MNSQLQILYVNDTDTQTLHVIGNEHSNIRDLLGTCNLKTGQEADKMEAELYSSITYINSSLLKQKAALINN